LKSELTATLMGTGTSHGVPMLGCDCDVCCSENPKNKRTRTSLLLRNRELTYVIDTPPDLRQQLLQEKVKRVDAVLYTHAHADHIYGMDDLRAYGHFQDAAIPLFCEANVAKVLRESFPYAFAEVPAGTHEGWRPRVKLETIVPGPVEIPGLRVDAIRLKHGGLETLGYRVGSFAFCTDVNRIPEESFAHLENLDDFVIDALRHEPHPTHFSVAEALDVVAKVKPKRAWLTHISHVLEHEETEESLPPHVRVAYDGLTIPIRV
jgi:Metal-dependent hydrolases of the beta-lactamase superfamily I